jgi:hypothetical protein
MIPPSTWTSILLPPPSNFPSNHEDWCAIFRGVGICPRSSGLPDLTRNTVTNWLNKKTCRVCMEQNVTGSE